MEVTDYTELTHSIWETFFHIPPSTRGYARAPGGDEAEDGTLTWALMQGPLLNFLNTFMHNGEAER